MTDVLTAEQVAERWNVSAWTVTQMCRDGRLYRLPIGKTRIPLWAVVAVEEGRYDATDVQRDRQAPREATPSRRGNRGQAHRPLAGEAVVGSGAVHRPIGPATGDVVVRRVERGSR